MLARKKDEFCTTNVRPTTIIVEVKVRHSVPSKSLLMSNVIVCAARPPVNGEVSRLRTVSSIPALFALERHTHAGRLLKQVSSTLALERQNRLQSDRQTDGVAMRGLVRAVAGAVCRLFVFVEHTGVQLAQRRKPGRRPGCGSRSDEDLVQNVDYRIGRGGRRLCGRRVGGRWLRERRRDDGSGTSGTAHQRHPYYDSKKMLSRYFCPGNTERL
ncbi:unnamed protein product [Amoebophrya sp. A120]|nr:unnamed protein product [Amoebophrya sp. A120]|eukprot:GSA120T00016512001.1